MVSGQFLLHIRLNCRRIRIARLLDIQAPLWPPFLTHCSHPRAFYILPTIYADSLVTPIISNYGAPHNYILSGALLFCLRYSPLFSNPPSPKQWFRKCESGYVNCAALIMYTSADNKWQTLCCLVSNVNRDILLTYLLTYSMQQSPSWEANWFSGSQEIPRILWNPKVHYRIHMFPPSVPVLSHLHPDHAPTSNILKIRLNIILPSTPGSSKWFISLRFPHQNPVYASSLSHTWQVGPCHHVWRVLKLWMEERPAVWRVAANILNKRSRTAHTGCSSSLGFGRGANNSSPKKRTVLRNVHKESLGPVLILWYELNNGKIVISSSTKCCQIYWWLRTAWWVLSNIFC